MRNITATTTDEQIMSGVVAARKTLAEDVAEAMASEYLLGDRLVKSAQNVKSAEAVALVALRYRDLVQNTDDKVTHLIHLSNISTRGADDTWSGRGNDSNRSANDAVQAFVGKMVENIRYAD